MPNEKIRSDHPNHPRAHFAETGQKIGHATLQAQNEFFKALEQIGREVASYAAAEAEAGLQLTKKLAAAHSVPDAFAVYQEWLGEELGTRAENTRRLMADSQKFIETSTQRFSNGWSNIGARS
jgi:Phasin protein